MIKAHKAAPTLKADNQPNNNIPKCSAANFRGLVVLPHYKSYIDIFSLLQQFCERTIKPRRAIKCLKEESNTIGGNLAGLGLII